MTNKKINVAIVGLGNISKKHINAINKFKKFRLVSACDPKKEIKGIKNYKSIDKMLKSQKNIDIVSIASPSGEHFSQIFRSLRFKKNVIVEKPMCMNFLQAKKLLNYSVKFKREVFVVYQNRLNPLVKIVKNKISNQTLGKLITFNSNLYWNRDDRYFKKSKWRGSKKFDGGVVMNQGTHNIDIFLNFFGKIKSVYCSKVKIKKYLECEDTCNISFIFKNGLIGSFNLSTAVNKEKYINEIEILGLKKNIKLCGRNLNILEYQKSTKTLKERNDLHYLFYKSIYEILSKNKRNIFSISSVLENSKVMDSINKSLRSNTKISIQ